MWASYNRLTRLVHVALEVKPLNNLTRVSTKKTVVFRAQGAFLLRREECSGTPADTEFTRCVFLTNTSSGLVLGSLDTVPRPINRRPFGGPPRGRTVS